MAGVCTAIAATTVARAVTTAAPVANVTTAADVANLDLTTPIGTPREEEDVKGEVAEKREAASSSFGDGTDPSYWESGRESGRETQITI